MRPSLLPQTLSCAALLVGCGGGASNSAPVATPSTVAATEDVSVTGQLVASDADGDALNYVLTRLPASGSLRLDPRAGTYTYLGAADFNGADSFEFVAVDDLGARSKPAIVVVNVMPVNDAPRIGEIAPVRNSAEQYEVVVPIMVTDVEGDPIGVSVDVLDQDIARASFDAASRVVRVSPGAAGETVIQIQATDGALSATRMFTFKVETVTKSRSFSLLNPMTAAIRISNTLSRDIRFSLRHGDSALATSTDQLVEEALAIPASGSTPLAQRLWAYVNSRTYHWYGLSGEQWSHDPLIMLNSVGFGLCDDVSATLVLLARSAGLAADVWALEGHVVAEITESGASVAYDPDLSVYYRRRDRQRASVADLSSDASLITAPVDPIISPVEAAIAYSPEVAAIYATQSDNTIEDWYVTSSPPLSGEIRLPPGATVTYPGIFGPAPTFSGQAGTQAPAYANLKLTVPAGWTGHLDMPLVLKAIRGSGRVNVGTAEYEVSEPLLQISLGASPYWISSVDVLRADTDLEFVFLLNPLRFEMRDSISVAVSSLDAWSLRVEAVVLDAAEAVDPATLQPIRKPRVQ